MNRTEQTEKSFGDRKTAGERLEKGCPRRPVVTLPSGLRSGHSSGAGTSSPAIPVSSSGTGPSGARE
jgi:hypothetical protein